MTEPIPPHYKLSLNDEVFIKLTDHGKGVLHAKHVLAGIRGSWLPPRQDKDGYSKWILWQLFAEFGLFHAAVGTNVLWEGDIRVPKRKDEQQ